MAAQGSNGFVPGFPADFGWGVSTSAYQIEGAVNEGGRGRSIWDTFSHEPGRTIRGEHADVSCDHYHRWQEDLDLVTDLGVDIYRFSIAWSRVMPSGKGPLNEEGVDFYSRLVDGLLERGIMPFPTLYHWDLPQALEDEGGWTNRDIAQRFAEYASAMFERLGDRVDHWQTHNEPWVMAFMGYIGNEKAPGLYNDWPRALRVSHHLLLSHGLAVQALRAGNTASAKIGIAPNLNPAHPFTDSPEDAEAALVWDGFQNRWFLDPVLKGHYPVDMLARYEKFGLEESIKDGDLAVISSPTDFLGVNFYQQVVVARDPSSPYLGLRCVPTRSLTEMGWDVTPEGLHELMLRLERDYGEIDIYITENGAAFPDKWDGGDVVEDPERVDYLARHIGALSKAIADGVPVKGYCVWSLLDNYEWEKGYDMRFGLYYVDYPTQRRIPKRSALWYRDQIAASRAGAS
ncbi:MAG TPA: GH1 family beta-glucosidase [Gaiellaceae bacterium]|jgi:beta-glucosidase